MTVSIVDVVDAFEYLYEKLLDPRFAKTGRFEDYYERDLLPLVRTYLLGRFDDVEAEVAGSLPTSRSRWGRIDFRVGDIAVEFAVSPKWSPSKYRVTADTNNTELQKLLRWQGPAVLVLFDFSSKRLCDADLDAFRVLPRMGRGNWRRSPCHVAYFCREGRPPKVRRQMIEVDHLVRV